MGEHTVKRVTSEAGVPMLVRILRKGEAYGRGLQLVHEDDEPSIEFYDTRHDHEPGLGQFVNRYHYSMLAGTAGWPVRSREPGQGLTLHGGEPVWNLSGATVDDVLAWVRDEVGPPPHTLRAVDDLPF